MCKGVEVRGQGVKETKECDWSTRREGVVRWCLLVWVHWPCTAWNCRLNVRTTKAHWGIFHDKILNYFETIINTIYFYRNKTKIRGTLLIPEPFPHLSLLHSLIFQHPEFCFLHCVWTLRNNWSCGSRQASLGRFSVEAHSVERSWDSALDQGEAESQKCRAEQCSQKRSPGKNSTEVRWRGAPKRGVSFAASSVLMDVEEGRISGQTHLWSLPWGLTWERGVNRLNLLWKKLRDGTMPLIRWRPREAARQQDCMANRERIVQR